MDLLELTASSVSERQDVFQGPASTVRAKDVPVQRAKAVLGAGMALMGAYLVLSLLGLGSISENKAGALPVKSLFQLLVVVLDFASQLVVRPDRDALRASGFSSVDAAIDRALTALHWVSIAALCAVYTLNVVANDASASAGREEGNWFLEGAGEIMLICVVFAEAAVVGAFHAVALRSVVRLERHRIQPSQTIQSVALKVKDQAYTIQTLQARLKALSEGLVGRGARADHEDVTADDAALEARLASQVALLKRRLLLATEEVAELRGSIVELARANEQLAQGLDG